MSEVLYKGSGRATIFGLEYNGRPDPGDNGEGFFGYNTTDESLHGVSLPVSVLDEATGLFGGQVEKVGAASVEHHPGRYIVSSVRAEIKAKQIVVDVTNGQGVTDLGCPVVDIGPAAWTGNKIDLTYATAHALNTGGDAQVTFQIRKV
jgi:hypothetical protein